MSPRARQLIAAVTLVLALVVVAVLTLRAFGVPIALGPLASPTPVPVPTDTPGPSTDATPSPDEITAAIEAAMADLRDLPPADIGPAEVVSRDELERRLAEQFAEDYPPEEVAVDNAILRALGLLTEEQDVAALQLQLLSSQVIGYYDDETQQMVIVTDAGLTPEAQVTYAHEYTHALQDAAFGIDSMALDAEGDDDGILARLGVVEGDATTAMVLWAYRSLSAEELLEISQTPVPDTTGVPEWMLDQLEFPYLAGSEFVAQLYAFGGWDAVDEAWTDPPTTTEQVLHYRAYLEDEAPIPVDDVDPDLPFVGADIAENTTFGEAMLAIWLTALGADPADADDAAAGWGGDRLVGLVGFGEHEGESAIILRVAFDSEVDADQFEEAYADALASLPVLGAYDRLTGTEMAVFQATSEALLEALLEALRPGSG